MVGELIADRYELEELVGTGGMSSVYRARDLLLERTVALKILHDTYGADEATVERFRREARAVAQLSHPNIVTVIDRGEDGGRQFIVFEYVEGRNLKDVVDREGALPVRRALEVAIQVGRGLAFAHQHGIVHRDVKPHNVLLNGDGEAKVTDFGIARSLHGATVTQTGTVLGTSSYISPEQASGGPVDAAGDVYSLGVVLFELLAGDVPYDGESFVAVAMRHLHDPVPSVLERRPDVPMRVAGALELAMAKAPEERFASMDDLVAELEACLAELDADPDSAATMIAPGRVVREGARPRVRERRAPWPFVLLVLGLVALVAVAVAVLLAGGPDRVPIVGDAGETAATPVELAGVRAHDPYGDDGWEHDDRAGLATDGDGSTYWTTQSYRAGLQKPGVGLVLDAGDTVELAALEVSTSTPGFTAEIRAGPAPEGPFERVVSPSQQVAETTEFPVEGDPARYYVVWITELAGPNGRITNVTARSP